MMLFKKEMLRHFSSKCNYLAKITFNTCFFRLQNDICDDFIIFLDNILDKIDNANLKIVFLDDLIMINLI